ncbi:MAG: helix-turn-helix transcriptional regulator [Clostridia bacterium]|nr:helix-turn-helix transcriptional regulator [Clostridia bacterium]
MIFRGMPGEFIELINEILEDIDLNGKEFKVIAIKDRQTNQINDYELPGQKKILIIDEERITMSLFDLLILFIYQNAPKELPQYACVILAGRNVLNLTQKQMAEKLGVNFRNYQKWEAGEVRPSLENILKLCSMFEIKPEYFL